MHITFESRTKKKIDGQHIETTLPLLTRIAKKAEKVLDKQLKRYCPRGAKPKDLGLSVFFVSDREIKALNKDFRGKDRPTDVITFSFVEKREFMPFMKGETYPAGEIFLSVDTVARQAREQHLPFEQEMAYMLVHGILHTFGYDHADEREERAMEKQSFLILGKLYPRTKEFGFSFNPAMKRRNSITAA